MANKHINRWATCLLHILVALQQWAGRRTLEKDGWQGSAEVRAKVPKVAQRQDPVCGQVLFDPYCITKNLEPIFNGIFHMKIQISSFSLKMVSSSYASSASPHMAEASSGSGAPRSPSLTQGIEMQFFCVWSSSTWPLLPKGHLSLSARSRTCISERL